MILIPIAIGVASLAAGLTGGYFLFSKNDEAPPSNENSGIINNVVKVDESIMVQNNEVLILLIIIVTILVFKLIYTCYHSHRKNSKKRYMVGSRITTV